MYLYRVIEEDLYHEDIGDYRSYGIQCIRASYGIYEASLFVSDVACDREKAESIAALCRRYQVSPIHLVDVIIDLIG